MKPIITTIVLLIAGAQTTFAQQAKLNIDINTIAENASIWIQNPENAAQFETPYFTIPVKNGKASHTFNITQPGFFSFYCYRGGWTKDYISYAVYLRPGDDITLTADFEQPGYAIKVSGKGSNNNQPLLSGLQEPHIETLYGDTIPNRIIAEINKHQQLLNSAVSNYQKQYQPDAAFMKAWKIQAAYYSAKTYYSFKENNKFQVREAYKRNFDKWKHVQDSLFAQISLNNDDNMVAYNYTNLVETYLGREKERLWEESGRNPESFYKEWYNTSVAEGSLLLDEDRYNLLKEKIINKNFTGKTAEYLYAALFKEALHEVIPQNIEQIFKRFQAKYPGSKYIAWFKPAIDNMVARQQQQVSEKAIFAAENGTKLNTFEEVLTLVKGKTVLLDMWGTWCGPCRMEIEKNGKYIKDHFKDKGLDYLYVANFDMTHESTWKKLIAYFNLQGTHVLANEMLNKDIMAKVKGQGYPTYVVIKKDGTYELSKAGYPMDRDVLIKQVEEAIAVQP